MHVKSKSFVFTMTLLVVLIVAGCAGPAPQGADTESGTDTEDKLIIYTSIYPLYYFTQEIVGVKGEVINVIPAGTDPHDFEPTIQDIMQLSEADLFVYNGAGFEAWLGRIIEAVNDPELILVDSTKHILSEVHQDKDDEHHEHEHHEHGHHGHQHGDVDPHVWLDPNLAKLQAEAIWDAVNAIDGENSEYYTNNYIELVDKLENLDAQLQDLVEHAQRPDFVVSHAAFGHLASRYGFNQVAITGLHSEEPSTKQVQEIIRYIIDNDIEYILLEHMSTPKVAEVIQAEVDTTPLVLHNLESLTEEELAQGKDYFSIMEENLDVFKTALGYRP